MNGKRKRRDFNSYPKFFDQARLGYDTVYSAQQCPMLAD